MKRFMNKKVAAIAAAVGLTLGLGGAAFAYFTNNGSGNGSVTVGSVSAGSLTVTASAATGGALFPTASTSANAKTDTIDYTILNTTESDIGLTQAVITVQNSGVGNACLGSWFAVNGTTPTGTATVSLTGTTLDPNSDGTTVTAAPAANGDTYYGSLTIELIESGTTQNACQGVSPTVSIVVT